MKKFIALILALVMVLSLTAVAFASDDYYMTDRGRYNKAPDHSLARVIVNTVTKIFTGKGGHSIGFYGLDKIGLVEYHDDTVNAIADGIHDMINSVAFRIINLYNGDGNLTSPVRTLVMDIYGAANKLSDAFAFVFSINGRWELDS